MIGSAGSLATSSPRLALLGLLASLLLAHPLPSAASAGIGQDAVRRTATVTNGPLLVLDQRGSISAQVQITPQHDEILAVTGGRITQVLARGLTTYTCCAGLVPSPRGRYVAFSQTDAYLGGGRIARTGGLWLTTSSGRDTHLLVRPPRSTRPDEPFEITAVSWSPDRHTLAYAVNAFTDTPIAPSVLAGSGLWLTRTDSPQPRQIVSLAALARTIPALAACGPLSAGLSIGIDVVSWAADAHTIAVGVDCFNPSTPDHLVRVILAVDTATRRARVLVRGGRDAAFSPVTARVAYVTGRADGRSHMTLWVADAQGTHARKLVTAQGGIANPVWSPDGQRLAYLAGARSTGVVTIHTVEVATDRDRSVLADNQAGQALLPIGGHFTRLAWMAAPSPANAPSPQPFLSFTCTESLRSGVICYLAGRDFYPDEVVRIAYVVSVGIGDPHKHQSITTTYRRTATTDKHGSFTRPPLHFMPDPHNESFSIQVTVIGTRGDRATAGGGGGS